MWCLTTQYDAKLRSYLDEYEKAFLVHADNVGSKQFMQIRAVRHWHASLPHPASPVVLSLLKRAIHTNYDEFSRVV